MFEQFSQQCETHCQHTADDTDAMLYSTYILIKDIIKMERDKIDISKK